MSILLVLSVILSIGAVTAQAAYVPKFEAYGGLTTNRSLTGSAGLLNTYVEYCNFSSSVSDHTDSAKYTWCKTYSITNGVYSTIKTCSSNYTTSTVAHSYTNGGFLSITSITAKAEYVGDIYLTSSVGSGVLEHIMIRTLRSGAPNY